MSCGTIAFASGRLLSSAAAQPRTMGDQSPNAATSSFALIFARTVSNRPEAIAPEIGRAHV